MSAYVLEHRQQYTVMHFFGGMGGGAVGFQHAEARVGKLVATARTLGSIDVDARACVAFERLTGVPATCLDLFSRDQYERFHGHPPPEDWQEVTLDDIRAAAQHEAPDILFLSAPCKGFSGLNAHRSTTRKYVALNELTLRCIRLMLEAWGDCPPRLILFENVPRIATVGRPLLDEITALLAAAGYSVAETTHDCGELGGLAQHRHRFLLVARHRERVPPFLYEPETRRVRTIGEVIGDLPVPTPKTTGLHKLPNLQWKTWLRLALIKPGHDWRWLERYDYADDTLQGWRLVPERSWQRGVLGVRSMDGTTGTVPGESLPSNGAHSIADARLDCKTSTITGRDNEYRQLGVNRPGDTAPAVSGKGMGNPGGGAYSIADQRWQSGLGAHSGKMRVQDATRPARTITSSDRVGSGAACIGDHRLTRKAFNDVFRIVEWDEASQAVTAGATPTAGGLAVGDVRFTFANSSSNHARGGVAHYGVLELDDTARTVAAHARHDNGPFSVAAKLPADRQKCAPLIVSPWGTWNRPFTTLECAALQGFDVEAVQHALDGYPLTACRGWIGNAVPPPSARAAASEFLLTLALADAGQTFQLSSRPIWVQPVSLALTMPGASNG